MLAVGLPQLVERFGGTIDRLLYMSPFSDEAERQKFFDQLRAT